MDTLEQQAAERVAAMADVARRFDPDGRLDIALTSLAKALGSDRPPAESLSALREMAIAVLGRDVAVPTDATAALVPGEPG